MNNEQKNIEISSDERDYLSIATNVLSIILVTISVGIGVISAYIRWG